MGVDIDLSQYCDVILLWNAAAMFFISFSTDYWEYRDYNYRHLVELFGKLNNTPQMDGWDKFKWRNLVVVQFSHINNCSPTTATMSYGGQELLFKRHHAFSTSYLIGYHDENTKRRRGNNEKCLYSTKIYLFAEHANLYRECNDLQDSSRLELSAKELLYQTPCHSFMASSNQFHNFHKEGAVRVAEKVAFGFGCLSMVMSCIALVFGTLGSIRRNPNCVYLAGFCLGGFTIFYLLATVVFLVKSQMLQTLYMLNDDILLDPYGIVKQIKLNHKITLGWSFVAAVVSLFLSVASAKVYIWKGRKMTKRRKSEIRRKRLEAALMSPCQQEVALALRAKMIVVQN